MNKILLIWGKKKKKKGNGVFFVSVYLYSINKQQTI